MSRTTKNTMATIKKEEAFVTEYCRAPNQAPIALVTKAGFNPRNEEEAEKICKRLLNRKSVVEAIAKINNDWCDALDGKARQIVSMILEMATFDTSEIYAVKDGEVVVKNTAEMSLAARNMIKTVSMNDGKITVTTHDRQHYVRILADVAGIMNKNSTPKTQPHPQQVQALRDVRNGIKSPVEAALILEAEGIPLPETIKMLLARPEIAVAVKQEVFVDIPTPEEIAERRKRLLEEVKNEKDSFLPARQAEVRELKADLGTANKAFDVTKE